MLGAFRARCRWLVPAVCGLTMVPLSAALAAWSADVTRDLNGRIKASLRGEVEGGRAIYATCDTNRTANRLALLVPNGEPFPGTTGFRLHFEFPDGMRWTSTAALFRYDANFVAVAYANLDDIPNIVMAFAAAARSVRVTVEIPATGEIRAFSADVRGSTAAARRFLDTCFPLN